MSYVHLVVTLALLEFLYFGFAVGKAREKYAVAAPATTGNEMFERYFRVQMNTMEQLILFIPGILIFSRYADPRIAAALGLLFVVGRAIYFRAYTRAPGSRTVGFALSAIPNVILLVGALILAAWHLRS
jgi:glutathione S-transferase